MELVISGAFADKILVLLKKDKSLATSLAGEWLARVDSGAIAEYLLTPEIAIELLAGRLVSAPEKTVKELQAIAAGETVKATPVRAPRKAPARKGGRRKASKQAAPRKAAAKPKAKAAKVVAKAAPRKAAKKAAKKAPRKPAVDGVQRRTRLPKAEIAGIKEDVISYLASVDAASRKQIIEAAKIPTPAIYNRIVGELRDDGVVGSEGQKAKAVYFLKKGKKGRKKRR